MLNTQQQLVFDHIINMQPGDRLRLDGEGGCGKTYVLTQVIEYLLENGQTPLVVAPTHMARQGLVNKVSESYRHLVQSRTLASLLGRYGFRTGMGDTAFSKAKTPDIEHDLVIIDECSMMSQKDLNALLNTEVPIVFSGDLKQLPVVKQKKALWDDIPTIKLTQQMRQSGTVFQLAQRLREEIYYPTSIDHAPNDGLHVLDDSQSMIDTMIAGIKEDISQSWAHRYLTYTNNEVYKVNATVRSAIWGEQSDSPFLPGEYILLEQTCSAGNNGEILLVQEVLDVQPNKVYEELTDYLVEFDNGHTLRVLSPSDRLKVLDIRRDIQDKLNMARALKHSEAIGTYLKQLEYLDYQWVEINYTHATTVHKSQGMTIPNVYVDTLSLSSASNKRALLYVAFSRASENLYTIEVPLDERILARQINADYKATNEYFRTKYGMSYSAFYRMNSGETLIQNKDNRHILTHQIKATDKILETVVYGLYIKNPNLATILR